MARLMFWRIFFRPLEIILCLLYKCQIDWFSQNVTLKSMVIEGGIPFNEIMILRTFYFQDFAA